ncbi:MAG: Holliday junction resolvase-like protein [Gemmatimonadota bacterium]
MPDLTLVPPLLLLLAGLGLGLFIAWLLGLLWKARYTKRIRRDAVMRSQATIAGQVHEQLLPYFPDFPFNPKDARFLGSPIDLIVFDGLDAGQINRIVMIEVKTGGSTLSKRERQIRDVIREGRISWQELRAGS